MSLPGVTEAQREWIKGRIRSYFPKVRIYFFGSRRTGRFKPGSDLDLCLRSENPLSAASLAKLQADFEESDLPFKVDLMDWSYLPGSMQEEILKTSDLWG